MANLPSVPQLAGSYGPLFEGYWTQLDSNRNGRINASTAAAFLKKSQLPEPILHKIWEVSDVGVKGYLDKQGFYTALRLVASCQSGREPSLSSLSPSDPPPKLVGVDSSSLSSLSQNKWIVSADERARYDQMFQGLQPVGGLLSGEKAKPVMLTSKLPVGILGKIWNLSDIDRDGNLDADEFAVAMRLITLCQAGETLPPSIPPSLLPPSKAGKGSSILTPPRQPSPSPSSLARTHSPQPSSSSPIPARKSTEWIVTPDTKAKYDSYFEGIDKDHDGLVSGEEARRLFMASNLPQTVLAHIWNLVDIQRNGKLNAEQFALAMYLIAEKVRGKEPPKELAPNMIPPSLWKQQPLPTTSSSSALTPSSNPLLTSLSASSVSVAPTTPTSATTTTPSSSTAASQRAVASEFSGLGFESDFSSIKELDNIATEIDSIRKEKSKLQEDIKQKQELIQQRKEEIETLQGKAGVYDIQREELEREKVEAQARLEQLDSEKAKHEDKIAELKQKCRDEQEEIDRLKVQLSQQESSKRAQAEELEKLKEQLESLRKEEREYRQKVEAAAAEVEKLQKANQSFQTEMNQVRQKIEGLKEEHHSLTNALSLYPPPGSTPGSTPSSSVININDVGQLSAELHVPHLGETDAISARATAGSSSPVSSISGFSTNSHLEEAGSEDTTGKTDDKQRSDPFASTSTAGSDPFTAFSGSNGDPFTSGGLFTSKPPDLSAFDPFGPSDPFKATSSSGGGGDDFFKLDPFSSAPPTSSSAGGTTTDPFSGQDPFSSDPFASSAGSKDTSQATWSSPFSRDPFGSQPSVQTPTDPFASGDPFADDPFAVRASDLGIGNPFSGSSSSEQQWSILPKPSPGASEAWGVRDGEREDALRRQREGEALARALKESLKTS